MPVGDPPTRPPRSARWSPSASRSASRSYIAIGQEEGAKVVVGGLRPAPTTAAGTSQPTVFADVDNDMRIAREEIFGPVLAVIPYDDEDDAVRIANDSDYGLAGSVWTADIEHGIDIARRVRTGTYGVNMLHDGLRRALRRLQGQRHRPRARPRGPRRPTWSTSRSPGWAERSGPRHMPGPASTPDGAQRAPATLGNRPTTRSMSHVHRSAVSYP